jgi:hypothetical protein
MMVILSAEDGKIITSVPAQRTEATRSRRFAMWRVAAIVAGGIKRCYRKFPRVEIYRICSSLLIEWATHWVYTRDQFLDGGPA